MDGLDDFEKALAAEKGERERIEREKEERRQRKKQRSHHYHHHHRDRDRSSDRHRDRDKDRERDCNRDLDRDNDRYRHRPRRHVDDEDGHRHKRSRHSRDDEGRRSRRHEAKHDESHEERQEKTSDSKEDPSQPDEEEAVSTEKTHATLVRDSWMTAPSALDIEYVQRKDKGIKPPPPREEPARIVHEREINKDFGEVINAATLDDKLPPNERTVSYKFGDTGSQWRMTKLKGVYSIAEDSGRSVEDVALERYGNLQEFDDAREEKSEMDRRKVYGGGYMGKEKPTGDLYRERMENHCHKPKPVDPSTMDDIEQGADIPDHAMLHTPIDQTALNRMRAQMMKAKLRRSPDAAKLEAEYNAAAASFAANGPQSVVLGVMDNRMLAGARGEVKASETKRGRERGNMEANEDMTIEDMVREERRTRGQAGGEGMRLAERIAKDGKFDNDLDYMDENAVKLAKRVHKSEINLKNVAVSEYQKVTRILDNCPLCHHEDKGQPPLAPVISLGTRVFLTLPTEPEISEGGAVITPIAHHKNLLECDDDEWEEMRNFMKSLTRMYHEKGQEVIFYENAAAPQRHLHAAMMAVPIPYEEGATAPAYFKEAFLTTDEEWSQHKKIIDTDARARDGMGRMAFRRSIAKEMPYFHAWFTLDGGLGHIVENSDRWPRGDLFAREIIGGILDAAPDVIKKQGRWNKGDRRVEGFKKKWRKFDWTRVLTDG